MAAINKRVAKTIKYSLNSGIFLATVKHTRLQSDAARPVIDEWLKHVSYIYEYLCFFLL